MTPATKENLIKAFDKHKKTGMEGYSLSHKLIRVYASECAVKAMFLKENGASDTEKVNIDHPRMFKKKKGHDLLYWARELRIPRFSTDPDTQNGKYPIHALHEHLRYSIPLPENVERSQMKFIEDIIDKVGKHL